MFDFHFISLSLYAGILQDDDQAFAEGYCIIDDTIDPPGLNFLLRDEDIYIQYAIPTEFETLSIYIRIADAIPLAPVCKFSVVLT